MSAGESGDDPDGLGLRVGIDLIPVLRVERLLAEQPELAARIFTEREKQACAGRGDRLAGRFAAKEAVLKVLGTGLGPGMNWTDVEVLNETGGRPRVRLYGVAAQRLQALGPGSVEVSIAHSGGLAIAQAVFVGVRREEHACSST
jgi:holo-[acyl-carrier protein] synthase